ncbi:MAG: GntR family transcriptional regulator [Pseudomonadota bacterium]
MQLLEKHPDRPGFRPLYQQVRELLLSRIISGTWRPAEPLPSEQALASELGVSQGTVRKALDSLAADQLVERRQGKGTYVSQHTPESALFRFFRLCNDDTNERALPACKRASISKRKSTPAERKALGLEMGALVFSLTRTRYVEETPALFEEIVVPAQLMPNLDTHQPLPNTLYAFYQSTYDATIVSAREQIKAVPAEKRPAQALNVPVGSPLLLVERRGFGLDDQPIEFRRTFYLSDRYHYAVDLT